MCSPARCGSCGKTTWSGCGMHVDAVLSRVPQHRRCTCERNVTTQRPARAPFWRKGR
jgi:hypothetical protein